MSPHQTPTPPNLPPPAGCRWRALPAADLVLGIIAFAVVLFLLVQARFILISLVSRSSCFR
jgi:hypothetical protein